MLKNCFFLICEFNIPGNEWIEETLLSPKKVTDQ